MDEQFLQAYDTFADAIFRHCALRVGDRESARDLMQETFLKAWDAARKGLEIQNMRAFLYKIANNLIIDTYRRDRGQASLEEMEEQTGFDPVDLTQDPLRTYAGSEIVSMLQNLEEPYRTAIVLRYIDGLEPRDIAELLGVSPNVISVRIHRGLKNLSTLLGVPTHA